MGKIEKTVYASFSGVASCSYKSPSSPKSTLLIYFLQYAMVIRYQVHVFRGTDIHSNIYAQGRKPMLEIL